MMQWLMMEETVGEEEEEVVGEAMMVRRKWCCCMLGCVSHSVGSPTSEWMVLADVAGSATCMSASSASCTGGLQKHYMHHPAGCWTLQNGRVHHPKNKVVHIHRGLLCRSALACRLPSCQAQQGQSCYTHPNGALHPNMLVSSLSQHSRVSGAWRCRAWARCPSVWPGMLL